MSKTALKTTEEYSTIEILNQIKTPVSDTAHLRKLQKLTQRTGVPMGDIVAIVPNTTSREC